MTSEAYLEAQVALVNEFATRNFLKLNLSKCETVVVSRIMVTQNVTNTIKILANFQVTIANHMNIYIWFDFSRAAHQAELLQSCGLYHCGVAAAQTAVHLRDFTLI